MYIYIYIFTCIYIYMYYISAFSKICELDLRICVCGCSSNLQQPPTTVVVVFKKKSRETAWHRLVNVYKTMVKIAISPYNGKTHYFDWAMFNRYFDRTRGNSKHCSNLDQTNQQAGRGLKICGLIIHDMLKFVCWLWTLCWWVEMLWVWVAETIWAAMLICWSFSSINCINH